MFKYIKLICCLVLVSAGYWWLQTAVFSLNDSDFNYLIIHLGWRGPLAMIGLVVAHGSWLTISTGYLFGSGLGFTYSLIGSVLGAMCAYGLGYWVLSPFLTQRHYQEKLSRVQLGLVALFFIPLFPNLVISGLLGMLQLTWKRFIKIILLGFIPNLLITNFLGGLVTTPEYQYVLIACSTLVVLYFLIATMLSRRSNKSGPYQR